jgi:hypothetical protein
VESQFHILSTQFLWKRPISCCFSAEDSWNGLSSLGELVTPEARSRKEFIDECKSGKLDGVLVTYRTFNSVAITGVFDKELVALLPESLKFICHNGKAFVRCTTFYISLPSIVNLLSLRHFVFKSQWKVHMRTSGAWLIYCYEEKFYQFSDIKLTPRFPGAGYDQVDVHACTKRGIRVSNVPKAVDDATADTNMFLILGALRGFNTSMLALRESKWRGHPPPPLGHDPEGKTLGILGMGGIGRNLKKKAEAFGMTIIYHNRNKLSEEQADGAEYVSFDDLLTRSDVLSLNLPLNVSLIARNLYWEVVN